MEAYRKWCIPQSAAVGYFGLPKRFRSIVALIAAAAPTRDQDTPLSLESVEALESIGYTPAKAAQIMLLWTG